jgi:2-polyprenyl-3-methyl-5-hydroxy-6-metoxy-1,4-benzoquinol methylase
MVESLLNIRCKICDSCNVSIVQTISVGRLIMEWRQQLGIDTAEIFENVCDLKLFKCQKCNLRFFMPDSYHGESRIYESLNKYDWYYMPFKWEHFAALRELNPQEEVLEIGCGDGNFLEKARTSKSVNAIGIDLNRFAVEKAKLKGFSVYCMDIQEAPSIWVNRFDTICAFQVLEHLHNPRDFLLRALSFLRPGGKLLLGVPNADSFLRYQFNVLDMPPHHSTRWDEKVMAYFTNLFPLSLKDIKQEPLATYHVGQFVDAYLGILLRNRKTRPIYFQRMKGLLTLLLIRSKTCRLLKGHTLYASFVRK